MITRLPAAKAERALFGREAVLDSVVQDVGRGCTLFALEGVTGIGKSELLREIAWRLERCGFTGTATLNAAQRTSEDLAIATLYVQLKHLAIDPEALVKQLQQRFTSDLPKTLWKFAGAVIADVLTLVTEKAEKTVETIQETITGQNVAPSAASQLEVLDGDNRRYFISEFLHAVAALGNRVVIAIDNFDSADVTLVSFIRFLIKEKPDAIALVIAHNTEVGDNAIWDNVLADLRAGGGDVVEVTPLNRDAIGDWFYNEIGRWPTQTELDTLQQQTHGRAFEVKLAIQAMKHGEESLQRDYLGYYERARRRLSKEAWTVAELLAVINRDALVAEETLASAAEQLGVENLGPALDELRDERLLKVDEGYLGLSHSLAQQSWLGTINAHRKDRLGQAWFAAVHRYDVARLTAPEVTALIPAIATSLFESRSLAEIADIGERLIASGQIRTGLELLDRTWRFKAEERNGRTDMLRSALTAARTRLNLGRYREVDEPLTQAELAASDDPLAQIQILLLRMKLALRRNAYAALRVLAGQLEVQAAGNPEALIEGELIVNAAYRDLLELDGLRASTERLLGLRDASPPEQQNAIDRALARSLAKLGDTDSALRHAETALSASRGLASIRTVGNANLALAEVQRYRRDFEVAIAAYRDAAAIARASGNRDSQLWSLLGEAAALIEALTPDKAAGPLDEVAALLAEPGYDHPLETAHASLLRVLAGAEQPTTAMIVDIYAPFQIKWPGKYLDAFRASGTLTRPTPL